MLQLKCVFVLFVVVCCDGDVSLLPVEKNGSPSASWTSCCNKDGGDVDLSMFCVCEKGRCDTAV